MSIKKTAYLKLFAAAAVTAVCLSGISVTANAEENNFIMSGSYISGYEGDGGDIVISADVSGVSDLAFSYNTAITSVTFEGDIEKIGGMAFCGCTSLEKVTFAGDVAFADGSGEGGIQFNAFMGCRSLKAVEFAENSRVDAIERAVFMDCENLTEVKLPNNVGSIGEYAFMNCPELTRLKIPSITGLDAFAAGYMYDEETEKEVKADGAASVRACLDFDSMEIEDVLQKPITLIVSENSPAEKYAEENGIAYEYKTNSDTADIPDTENSHTGENTSLPAIALLTVIAAAAVIAGVNKSEN